MTVPAGATRGRLGAYAVYQARDYWKSAGAGTLLIVFFVNVVPMLVVLRAASEGDGIGDTTLAFKQMIDTLVQFLAALGPILAVSGLASQDRHPGLVRFLFSKPVSVRAYYLQAWVVRGASLLVLTLVVAAAVGRFVTPLAVTDALVPVGLAWLLIGGVGFVISVLIPRDTAALFAVFIAPTLLDAMRQGVPQWTWVEPVLTLLPPTHKLGGIRTALLNDVPVAMADVWHIALFGIGSVALATYLVRRMPLVR